jgi:hypothetical protein
MSDKVKVSTVLDSIADRLEAAGLMKEAAKVDATTNTIDALDAAVAGRVSKPAIIKMISDLQDVYDMHPHVREDIEAFEKAMMKEFGITDKELVSHDVELMREAAEEDKPGAPDSVVHEFRRLPTKQKAVEFLKDLVTKAPHRIEQFAGEMLELLKNVPVSGIGRTADDKESGKTPQ